MWAIPVLLKTTRKRRRLDPSRSIAVGAALLVALTVIGGIPSDPAEDDRPEVQTAIAPVPTPAIAPDPLIDEDTPTLAGYFNGEGVNQPSIGEGQGTIVIADPTAPPAGTDLTGTAAGADIQLAQPPATLPDVEPVTPTHELRGVDVAAAATVAQIPGVLHAAAATVAPVELQVPDGARQVTIAAVDPTDFRIFTPEITATEPAVWQRIIAGDAAFTHDSGNRLTVPLGASVAVPGDPIGLRVGVYASNGIPPVADAIISQQRADIMGLTGETRVLMALEEGAADAVVIAAIEAAVGATPEALAPPETNRAFLTGSDARNFFEPFDYIDHGDGLITIDPAWVARNIETRRVPIFRGEVTCHRQYLLQVERALLEVEQAGLAEHIDVNDYGGCWVARHIDWRPDRPISMHGWGLAMDFNVQTNGLGAQPTMHPGIVEIFDRWGFVWGGRWSRPDGMHFELGAVIEGLTPLS